MKVLSLDALAGIKSYEYKSGSYTYLDYKLTPFWDFCVSFLPLWLAPNLVTLLGTILTLVATLSLVVSSPAMDVASPSYLFIFNGISLFIYQTLDAIDGKQARRTNSSSPLGQLFDHGCDALCAVLNVLAACIAVNLGASWETFFLLVLAGSTFYLAQVEEYHTGTMSCGNGYIGVTEGQLMLVLVHFITAAQGQQFWHLARLDGWSLIDALLVLFLISNIILAYSNISGVINRPGFSAKDLGNKRVSSWDALLHVLPVVFLALGGMAWIAGPDNAEYASYPMLYLGTVGIEFAFLSSRMIVSHMTKVPFSLPLSLLLPLLLLLINAYGPQMVPTLLASVLFALYVLTAYLFYISHVCKEICLHLNINLLTLPKRGD